jgi:hypothetical protein
MEDPLDIGLQDGLSARSDVTLSEILGTLSLLPNLSEPGTSVRARVTASGKPSGTAVMMIVIAVIRILRD